MDRPPLALVDAFMEAARQGVVGEVRRLLGTCPQLIGAVGLDGNTALHAAASRLRTAVIAVLIALGGQAAALQQNKLGETPLLTAVRSSQLGEDAAAIQLLLVANPAAAVMPDTSGTLPLHVSAAYGAPALVGLLLAAAPQVALQADSRGLLPFDRSLQRLSTAPAGPDRRRALESARSLLPAHDAPYLLTALRRPTVNADRVERLFADLAERHPLTAEQYAQVPMPCAGLASALAAVLIRSEAEAALLARHLTPATRQRLRRRVLATALMLGRLATPDGLPLPPDVRRRVVALLLDLEAAQ